jgi:hypothetical protein
MHRSASGGIASLPPNDGVLGTGLNGAHGKGFGLGCGVLGENTATATGVKGTNATSEGFLAGLDPQFRYADHHSPR